MCREKACVKNSNMFEGNFGTCWCPDKSLAFTYIPHYAYCKKDWALVYKKLLLAMVSLMDYKENNYSCMSYNYALYPMSY